MWTITGNLESPLYKKGVKSVLHFSNTFHPILLMNFANMELRIAVAVGGKNYPYSIWEGEFGRQQNSETSSNSHPDKALRGLRTLAPTEIRSPYNQIS